MKIRQFNKENIIRFLKDGLFEAFYAFVLVIAFIWLLTQVAIYISEKPQKIKFKTSANELVLTPYNATINGEMEFAPTTLEEQKSKFSYWYGRELLKERKNRYVSLWASKKASLSWVVNFKKKGVFEVSVQCMPAENAGGQAEIFCGVQKLSFKINPNGVVEKQLVGEFVVDHAGVYNCKLKAIHISKESLCQFKSIVLRQKE